MDPAQLLIEDLSMNPTIKKFSTAKMNSLASLTQIIRGAYKDAGYHDLNTNIVVMNDTVCSTVYNPKVRLFPYPTPVSAWAPLLGCISIRLNECLRMQIYLVF